MAKTTIKDKSIHSISVSNTTGATGVFQIPNNKVNPTNMYLVNVFSTVSGHYAGSMALADNTYYCRIERYDGEAITNSSETILVEYRYK